MVVAERLEQIEGFEFGSYTGDLVRRILVQYLSGNSLNDLAAKFAGEGATYAQIQRVVDKAVMLGNILPEEKRTRGWKWARERAREAASQYYKGPHNKNGRCTVAQMAQMAGVSPSTMYRRNQE